MLGTTFSGCCYAFAHTEQVIDIVKWLTFLFLFIIISNNNLLHLFRPKQTNSIYPKVIISTINA
jgi:hypothetical protein